MGESAGQRLFQGSGASVFLAEPHRLNFLHNLNLFDLNFLRALNRFLLPVRIHIAVNIL